MHLNDSPGASITLKRVKFFKTVGDRRMDKNNVQTVIVSFAESQPETDDKYLSALFSGTRICRNDSTYFCTLMKIRFALDALIHYSPCLDALTLIL